MLRIILFLFSFFFAGVSIADTYPSIAITTYSSANYGVSDTLSGLCQNAQTALGAGYVVTVDGVNCRIHNSLGSDLGYFEAWPQTTNTCPYGGSVSGSNCINAPACTAPAVRDSTGECKLPPSCPNTVNGSMITKQEFNSVTQQCVNSDIVHCDSQLQIPDADSGTCLPKPGAKDCGNGIVVIAPVPCSSEPDHSQDITCPDGTIISPPRVCALLPPDPKDCPGGASAVETTGYVNGVPTCIMKDTTTTAAADGSQSPADDQYNPQSYKAGVACNASYSYPCDPKLPVVTAPGVTGIEKCGPGTFFTCADVHNKPVVPDLHPKAPATTTAAVTGTSTSTTTITHSDGSTSTQTSVTNNTGTTTTTLGGSSAGLATEDTVREIASRLGGLVKGQGNAVVPQTGLDHFDDSIPDDAAELARAEYQAKFQEVKAAIASMFSFSGAGTGQLPSFDFGTIKGVPVTIDLGRYADQLSYVGLIILFLAAVIAVMILLG